MSSTTLPKIDESFDAEAWLAQLGEIGDEAARRAFFDQAPQSSELAPALHAEVLRFAYADVERAARFTQAVEWLAAVRKPDDTSQAFALRCRGHVCFARGQHTAAIQNYSGAVRILENTGRDLDLGRTLNSGLQSLIYVGEYDRALEWAARARTIFSRHGDELRLARLASNMGNILFRQDRHAEAMEHYQAALEPLERLGEPRDLAAVLSNMAVCCTSLRRFREALAHYQAARDHCVRHNLPVLVAAADYNIAYLHYLRADYLEAARLYRVSRENAERAGDLYHVALCDLDESEMCLELNLSDEADRLAQSAALRFAQSGMNYERAKAVVNQAMAASHSADYPRALTLLRDARRLFENENNQVWPALIDLYQAILHYREGRYLASQRFARKAAHLLSGSALIGKAALCELLRAQLFFQGAKLADAHRRALTLRDTLDPDSGPSLRFHVHFFLGQVEEALGNAGAAWQAYQLARAEIETLRSRLWADDLKISILKDKLAVYEALVWLAMWRGEAGSRGIHDAFELIQQAKSRSLADQIALPWHGPQADSRLEERIGEIRRDLNWHYRQMEMTALAAKSNSAAELAALRNQTRQQEELLASCLSGLSAAGQNPLWSQGGSPLSLEQIRGTLAADTTLLEYYEVRGTVYVCLLGRSELRIVPLASSSRVHDLLRRLQLQLQKFRLPEKYVRTFESPMLAATLHHLAELHELLIGPIRPILTGRQLVIAPNSFLHQLPFHALCSQGRFLIDDFSISYAPSASVYALCAARESTFEECSLVMGVPDFATPSIETEVHAAARQLPRARLFKGDEATTNALREYGPTSRFIHIATHGYYRSDNPLFSSIRLGDRHLNLFDLYQLPLSAELVTLSGCSTGLTGIVGADELVGLMRGLLCAGAHGILVSLWDVQDRTTCDFMRLFYEKLHGHGQKAEALRSAMLEIKQVHPHPFFWAPFILVGKHENAKKLH